MRDKSGRFVKFINKKEKCFDCATKIFGFKFFLGER